jgi:hypothetical protein
VLNSGDALRCSWDYGWSWVLFYLLYILYFDLG